MKDSILAAPILEMRGIKKSFHGVKALNDVNLTIHAGQIHAIVGENGADKSTLMKVLSGVYPYGDYEGNIRFFGKECHFMGIADSEGDGIIIHQELALVPLLSITENIFLGNEQAHHGVIDWSASFLKTQELLRKVGLKESPSTLITNLGWASSNWWKSPRPCPRKSSCSFWTSQRPVSMKPTATLCWSCFWS